MALPEKSPVVSDRRKFISGLFRGWFWCSILWIVFILYWWFLWATGCQGNWRAFWSFFLDHDGWLIMVGWPLGLGMLVAVVFGIYFALSKPT